MSVGLSRGSERQKGYTLYVFIYMKCKNGQNSPMLAEVGMMVPLGGAVATRRPEAGVFCRCSSSGIWDSSNIPQVYDTCTVLHVCYVSIRCF